MHIHKRIIQRNFTNGRPGQNNNFWVLHTYNGPGRTLYGWFNNPSAGASAHYSVFLDGTIEQYVEIGNTAWHAGHGWANVCSIGIETQDHGNPFGVVRTPQQIEGIAYIIAQTAKAWGIKDPWNRLDPHKKWTSTGCPANLENYFGKIKGRVQAMMQPPKPVYDKFYRVVLNDKQIGAFIKEEHAFDVFINNPTANVTFQGNNLSNQFSTRMNKLNAQITKLEQKNKALEEKYNLSTKEHQQTVLSLKKRIEEQNNKINDLKTKNNYQWEEIQDCHKNTKNMVKVDEITLTMALKVLFQDVLQQIRGKLKS